MSDDLFFVSVKRLVRRCMRRERVSDPRLAGLYRTPREKRRVLGMIRAQARVSVHIRGLCSGCGWFLCVCGVVLSAIRAFGGCLGTRRR